MAQEFDLVVIGAGSGGLVTSVTTCIIAAMLQNP